MASPSIKPPINKKITSLEYAAAVTFIVEIFSNGNRINGSKAVTGIGKASVTQSPINRAPTAITFAASGFTPKGLMK